jgi:hypothetical protein
LEEANRTKIVEARRELQERVRQARDASIAAKHESRRTVQQTRIDNRGFMARVHAEELERRKTQRSLDPSPKPMTFGAHK